MPHKTTDIEGAMRQLQTELDDNLREALSAGPGTAVSRDRVEKAVRVAVGDVIPRHVAVRMVSGGVFDQMTHVTLSADTAIGRALLRRLLAEAAKPEVRNEP